MFLTAGYRVPCYSQHGEHAQFGPFPAMKGSLRDVFQNVDGQKRVTAARLCTGMLVSLCLMKQQLTMCGYYGAFHPR
jgi:hypothetical protein